jgi:hypothetical protein
VTPPIDHTRLREFLDSLPPEAHDPYEYLTDLSPDQLLNRRVTIKLEINSLEKEKTAIDAELQRIYSDPELQWGVRGSDGWVLRQRTRTSWQYSPTVKEQILTIQKSAQRSGDATELRTTYLVLTQEDY